MALSQSGSASLGALIALMGVLVAGGATSTGDERVLPREEVLRAGAWSACVVSVPVGDPMVRAISYDQTVYRTAPAGRAPDWILEQTSTGSIGIRLREDGVLLVQPVGEPPRLYFPGVQPPLPLALPGPVRWSRPWHPLDEIAPSNGYAAFLGDILIYGRYASPNDYLVGFAKIDAEGRRISRQCVCVEVSDGKEGSAATWAAEIGRPAPVRIGRYVFWRNRGYQNDIHPDAVTGTWKVSTTRVVDLETCALLTPGDVPPELLVDNRRILAPFLF